jgi:hypothetical protein
MNIGKSICNLLIFLFIVYYGQGIFYVSGGVISRLAILIIMSISFIYFIKVVFIDKAHLSVLIKSWTALLLLNIIGFFLNGDLEKFSFLQPILINMLPFYVFYYFSKKRILVRNHLIFLLIVLLPLLIIKFIQSGIELEILKGREDVVDNAAYLFLGLLPFIFLFKKKIISLFLLLVFWFFIMQSAKRAVIICLLITILIYFYYLIISVDKKLKVFNYAFLFTLIFVIIYWGYQNLIEQEFVLSRIQKMAEGDSSGRDGIASIAFASWYESNSYITLLFGNGFLTTLEVTSMQSHNDWIELLVSFGLLGFVLFFLIFYYLIKEILHKDLTTKNRAMFICFFCIAIITSITSRWYGSNFAYSQVILLPYLLSRK